MTWWKRFENWVFRFFDAQYCGPSFCSMLREDPVFYKQLMDEEDGKFYVFRNTGEMLDPQTAMFYKLLNNGEFGIPDESNHSFWCEWTLIGEEERVFYAHLKTEEERKAYFKEINDIADIKKQMRVSELRERCFRVTNKFEPQPSATDKLYRETMRSVNEVAPN